MVSDLTTPLPWSSPFVFMGKHLDVFRQPLAGLHRVITTHAKLIYFIDAHAIAFSSRRDPRDEGKTARRERPNGPG